MAAKMAVDYKNIRKFSPRPVNSSDLHAKHDFTDSWVTDIILVTSQHHSVFDIFKMVSRQVAGSRTLPVGMSGGFVRD